MKTLSILRTLSVFGCILFFLSCTPNEEATQKPQQVTFETIEKGTSLEDARTQLDAKFEEHKIGQQPDLVVLQFEDGRQLGFTDGRLTDKNTAEEIEAVKAARAE